MSDVLASFANAYKNEPTYDNLIKLIQHHFSCDLIIITWYIGHGYWYIPGIYDFSNINKKIDNYVLDEPGQNNISVYHTKVKSFIEIKSKEAKALIGWSVDHLEKNKVDYLLECIIQAFLDRLALTDLLYRQKFRQELMLSNISHSIRTPLNGILHMTKEITTSFSAGNADKKEAIKYLNQSTVALATNIFDIIDMTKLELGKLVINKEVFNLRDLIHNTMELANSLNKSKKVALDVLIDPSVPEYIYSDSKRIKQILINLLENALQHTQKGGIFVYLSATIIDLAAEDSNRGNSLVESSMTINDYQYVISFTVRDTGPGIEAKYRSSLFKPMEILTNSKQQGISLRISYLLAKALNGNLRLVSSDLGVGSCFEFTLIACEEEPPVQHSNTLKNLKDKSILFIDELNNKVDICKVFEKYHMKYTLASTYEELAILHKDKHFDLIICQLYDLDSIRIGDLFKGIPTLAISDRINKSYTYSIQSDYTDITIKTKLIEIFSGLAKHDNSEVRLLIVEDEQINRIVIEKLLRQLGYIAITMATNGEEAINIYSRDPHAFDVLLIDIRMPLMSGFELSDAIYKINPLANMIGVTAQMVLEDEIRPWFKDFVYKPIDSKELQAMILAKATTP